MQFDHVIQEGVWMGSSEQIACIEQTVRDAIFEDFDTIESYLEQIVEGHSGADMDPARGPIDNNARSFYEPLYRNAWNAAH